MSLQEKMHALYSLDRQVCGLQSRLDTATSRHRQQLNRLDQLNQQHRELADQAKHIQASANGFELQSQEVEARTAKLRQQMNTVTSNKEYSAMLLEISSLKNEQSKFEDEALEQLSSLDQTKAEMAQLDERIAQQQKLVAVAQSDVAMCKQQVGDRLEALTAERDQAADQVPAVARMEFERIAHIHDGETMAQVSEQSRKLMEYTCDGCFMNLPAERVNTLMTRPQEIVCCTSCGRILYLDQELKASFAR